MAIDPRGMTPENLVADNAQRAATSAAAPQKEADTVAAMQQIENMHNEIIRAQVLTGKTFYSESGQAGAGSKYTDDTPQDPASVVGSQAWWDAQITARESAAASNTQATPASPSTPGYQQNIAPPAQSTPQSNADYIASLPKPFVSPQAAANQTTLDYIQSLPKPFVSYQAQQPGSVLYNPVSGSVVSRVYMPEGRYAQQEFSNAKLGFANEDGMSTGEMGLYTLLPGGRMAIDPNTEELTPYILRGGGSRNFMQSGMGGFAAATPLVYAEGGVGRGELATSPIYAPGVLESGITPLDIQKTIVDLNSGRLSIFDIPYSRLGSEAYGGIVTKLDNRTLGNITYEDVSNRAPWNFARYVNPTDVNLPKYQLPGVNIPWGVGFNAPAIFSLTSKGGVGAEIQAKSFFIPYSSAINIDRDSLTSLNLPIPFKSIDSSTGVTKGTQTVASPISTVKGDTVGTIPISGSPSIYFTGQISKIGEGTGLAGVPGSYSYKETIISPSDPSLANLAKNTAAGIVNTLGFGLINLPTSAGFELKQIEEKRSVNYPAPFLANAPQGYTPTPITFDKSQSYQVSEKSVYEALNLGISNTIPKIPIETQLNIQKQNDSTGYVANLAMGGYQAVAERPLDVAKYASLGVIFAAGGALVSESAIAASAGTRLAGAVSTATRAAPLVLGGIYGYSIAERATLGFSEGGTPAAARLGGIASTEAIPMIAGGYGYSRIGSQQSPSVSTSAAREPIAYKTSEILSAAYGRIATRIAEVPTGVSKLAKEIPTYPERAYFKYIEMREPATSMGSPAASERFISTQPKLVAKPSWGVASRENPALVANRAATRTGLERLSRSPSSKVSAQDPLYTLQQAAQPQESGGISAIFMGKSGSAVIGQSPFTVMRDAPLTYAKKPISGMLADYQKPVPITKPYDGVTTKTPTGSLVSKVESAVVEPTNAPQVQMRESYPSSQRQRSGFVEEELQYYRTPEGMQRPAPQESTSALKRMGPEFTVATRQETGLAQGLMQEQKQRQELQYVFKTEFQSIGSAISTELAKTQTPTTLQGSDQIQRNRVSEIQENSVRTLLLPASIVTPDLQFTSVQEPRITTTPNIPRTPPDLTPRNPTPPDTPRPPIDIPKIPPFVPRLGYIPGSGGGGGGRYTRKRRKVELFSFEMGEDTPIPTRYGLGGRTTEYIAGSRGIAANILNPSDIAPNRLFDIGRRSSGDRL